MPWSRHVTSMAKRLGEDRLFSGAFFVFCSIFAIFRRFCLEVNKLILIFASESMEPVPSGSHCFLAIPLPTY